MHTKSFMYFDSINVFELTSCNAFVVNALMLLSVQMLPVARECLQLVIRANLMFFYFEGGSFISEAHSL